MITLFIIGIVIFLGGGGWMSIVSGDDYWPLQWLITCAGVGMIILCGWYIRDIDVSEAYDQGQIDALKGIQTHEIHYVYPKGDTIPSDTLYIKIEE